MDRIPFVMTLISNFLKINLQVIKRDLKDRGYLFQWSKMDAQQYLLRQRRNRVYGCADLDEGQDAKLFCQNMQSTIENMASDVSFPFDDIFDRTLPKCALHGNALDQVNAALEASISKCESQNLFVDTSTSSQRNPEAAEGVTTCIRPSHPIYSTELQRFVTAREMFLCQGLFPQDFENPAAVQHLWETDPKQAQDLAGNAFASTCAQVQLLASLIHAKGWSHIGTNDTVTTGSSSQHSPRRSMSNDAVEQGDHDKSESPSDLSRKRSSSMSSYLTSSSKRTRFEAAPAAKPHKAGITLGIVFDVLS